METHQQDTMKPDTGYEMKVGQSRKCDAKFCTAILTNWLQPVGYSGPVYCRHHAYLARK